MDTKPTLTPAQRAEVNVARALLAADAEGQPALAAFLEISDERGLYPSAFGAARYHIGQLLTVIDALTGEES